MTQSSSSFCRRITWAAGLAAAGLLMATGQAFAAAADDGQILRENAPNAIPESYIVVLEDDDASRAEAQAAIASLADEHDADVEHRYVNTVRGFSATMTREQALELSTDPAVAYVEQDRTVTGAGHPGAHAVLGPGPHRPARPAAQQLLHLRRTPAPASPRTSSTPASAPPTATSAGARRWGTNTTGDGNNTRLQRARHARGRHGRRRAVRRRQGRPAGRRQGPRLRRQRLVRGRRRRDRLGHRPPPAGPAGGREHEPRRPGSDAGDRERRPQLDRRRRHLRHRLRQLQRRRVQLHPGARRPRRSPSTPPRTPTRASSFSNYGTCTDIFAPG